MRNKAAIFCCVDEGVFFCVGSSGLHFDHCEFHILNIYFEQYISYFEQLKCSVFQVALMLFVLISC